MVERKLTSKIRNAYKKFVSVLLKNGITRYAIIGGIATELRSNPPATFDLDILIDYPDHAGLYSLLEENGYEAEYPKGEVSEWFPKLFANDHENGVRIDVFISEREFDYEVLYYANTVIREGTRFMVSSVEHIILYKLIAMRDKDEKHIQLLVNQYRDVLNVKYLKRWAKKIGVTEMLEGFIS